LFERSQFNDVFYNHIPIYIIPYEILKGNSKDG